MSDPTPPFPIEDDTPLTLAEACRIFFRDTITPATLRVEARRGNLAIERIGRRDFVTKAGIKAMREACRVQPPAPGPRPTVRLASRPNEGQPTSGPRAALMLEIEKRKEEGRHETRIAREARKREREAAQRRQKEQG